MMLFALSKINLLILVVALFTIVVYFTFGFQGILLTNLARQEARKAIEQVSEIVESEHQCGSLEMSVPEKLEISWGSAYYFLMEIRAVEMGDVNSLVFSIIGRDEYRTSVGKGRQPKIAASERRDQKAAFRIFSIDEGGRLCPSDSVLLGFGLGPIPIDTVVVLKEIAGGVNNIYLVPCTSANKEDCREKTQRVACLIKHERGLKSRCADTPEDPACSVIITDMGACPAV